MTQKFYFSILAALFVAAMAISASRADVVNFTETYANGDANWRGPAPNGSDALVVVGSGGPDGSSFVSTDLDFEFFPDGSGMGGGQPNPTLFRAQDEFGSSGGAFEGNWITSQVETFSFSFRHDLPVPVNVFARFSSPNNFPGAAAIEFIPLLPGRWTVISFDIDPANPQIIYEGPASTFQSVFSNIGHVQLGISVPVGFGGTTTNFNFDIDNVRVTTVVPEPGFGLIAGWAMLAAAVSRRNRR